MGSSRHFRHVSDTLDVLAKRGLWRDIVHCPRRRRGKPGHLAGRISLIGLLPLPKLVIGRRGAVEAFALHEAVEALIDKIVDRLVRDEAVGLITITLVPDPLGLERQVS